MHAVNHCFFFLLWALTDRPTIQMSSYVSHFFILLFPCSPLMFPPFSTTDFHLTAMFTLTHNAVQIGAYFHRKNHILTFWILCGVHIIYNTLLLHLSLPSLQACINGRLWTSVWNTTLQNFHLLYLNRSGEAGIIHPCWLEKFFIVLLYCCIAVSSSPCCVENMFS